MEKKCIKCNINKDTSEFYKQKCHSYGVMSYCKKCFNLKCSYRWIKRKIKAIKYLGGFCVDCNILGDFNNYSIFDFHHRNPDEKDFDWNKLRLKSWSSICLELDKCDLLCSNCHRIRHQKNVVPGGIEPPMRV